MTCTICGKPLTDPISLTRGIGPICFARKQTSGPGLFDNEAGHIVEGEFDGDVILYRRDGRPVVNLEQVRVLHSPTGFEWGYGGSGPADLALNILLRFTTPDRAYQLHQDFKWRFLASMPLEGGVIRRRDIEAWLEASAAPLSASPDPGRKQ